METLLTIVLIHGAGLGVSVWKDTERQLGVETVSIEFPTMNAKADQNKNTTFDGYMTSAKKQIDLTGKSKLVIVAHSVGGVVGVELAKYYADRMIGFVAIGAVIPEPGQSFVSTMPFPQNYILPFIMKFGGTKPPSSAIRKGLCNDLTTEKCNAVVENFTAESMELFTHKITSEVVVPNKLYVHLSLDKELSPSMQKQMSSNLGTQEIVTLESGHLPMLSTPDQLATILNKFIIRIKK